MSSARRQTSLPRLSPGSLHDEFITPLIPWTFARHNMLFERSTLTSNLQSVCTFRKLLLKARVFLHRRSVSSLAGILYTQKGANGHPTVHKRKPVSELSIQHIEHKTGQLLSGESVCEWVRTLAPTGLIFGKKKVAVMGCEVYAHTHIHSHKPSAWLLPLGLHNITAVKWLLPTDTKLQPASLTSLLVPRW